MEDVTDTVFRRIVAELARPDVCFTEFTNADGLCSPGRRAVSRRLDYTEAAWSPTRAPTGAGRNGYCALATHRFSNAGAD